MGGSGSTANTRPDGPTRSLAQREKIPMLAPTSKTVSPGLQVDNRSLGALSSTALPLSSQV